MALTTTTGANAIREAYAPGFDEAVFRNDSLMSLFSWQDAVGDTAFRWKLNSAGQSPEVFTEGQAQPAAGNQTWVNAAVSWTYFRVMLQATGHARDALRSAWLPAIDEEAVLGRADLIDLITTSFMGSTYGLELAVDYGSSYAGVTRSGSAGYFESTETDHSAALTTDALIDLQETIRNADKGGSPSIILCNLNQESNVYRLGGPHLITNQNPSDKTPGLLSNRIAGCDVVALPDFTTTVCMMLDPRPSNWAPRVIRPFSVKEMAPVGDSDLYQLSWGGALVCKMPKYQGKLTGVTA